MHEVNQSGKAGGGNSADISLEKRYGIFGDYVRTILSLATGALVLSVTFLHEIVGLGSEHASSARIRWPLLLGISWLGFLISVGGCLFYLYFLALASNQEREWTSQLKSGNVTGLAGFVIGLTFLVLFGWLNLP